ncbi:MAG: 3D domain-containing protein, partial [Planctomycetes bacterium]|nr:3D domain-containing protein [Planctomycetota bacterium]
CCGSHANGRTSTGTSAWTRGLAADPSAIPYGTYVFVPGYGYASVDDTGGAMRRVWRTKGMIHIDLRMNYHWQARQWGRKVLKVKVYDLKDQ